MIRVLILLALSMSLLACGNRTVTQSTFPEEGGGPDEFSVVPNRPLSTPQSFNDLPEPTPGGTNRANLAPRATAAAALGGRASASSGIPASDAALITYVSRAGVDSQARARASGGGLFGLFGRRTGGGATLDPFAEAERFRAAGVRVPTAPPE